MPPRSDLSSFGPLDFVPQPELSTPPPTHTKALFARRLHKMFSEPGAAERLGAKPAACFEADASPYCVGEGAGAIVLKRRADCVPGRERVYASIDALAEAATVEASAAYAMAEAKVTPG